MSNRDDRPRIAPLGEFYEDLLKIDSAMCGRSEAQQASIMITSKLQEREATTRARVRYLANKRGITFEEMWLQVLKGEYRKMTPDERQEIESLLPIE